MTREISGVGIGLRDDNVEALLRTRRKVDWLEVTPENWLGHSCKMRRLLDACIERWPITPHCVSVSVGGRDPLDAAWIAEVEALSRRAGAPFWSDHLASCTHRGVLTGQLLPVPRTERYLDHVAERAREIAGRTGRPFLVENLTSYMRAPVAVDAIDEVEFLGNLCEESGAGLLLDVNTVYINSMNHGFDAGDWLDRVPLAAVRQIHVAGHTTKPDLVIDDHSGPVPEAVWALYRRVIRRAGRPIPTLIEWELGVPSLDALLDEVDRARCEMRRALEPALVEACARSTRREEVSPC